jgi:hypothetical protein
MNAILSRMPALDRVTPPAPSFAPFAVAERTTLYDLIVRSIGADAADKLIADFGGRRLYIPIAPAPDDQIARSIGLLSALAMARVFGSDRLLIPVTTDHARRRVRILAMRADNVSVSRIARQLRCTERYVYKVLAVNRPPETLSDDCSPFPRGSEKRGRGLGSPTSAPIAERLKRGPIKQRV